MFIITGKLLDFDENDVDREKKTAKKKIMQCRMIGTLIFCGHSNLHLYVKFENTNENKKKVTFGGERIEVKIFILNIQETLCAW